MGVQISEVINLRLRGSKLSNDYGVKGTQSSWSTILRKGILNRREHCETIEVRDWGLRFDSLLINKHNARKGNGRPLGS